jgi:ATP-dependent DNA ligase
MDARGQARRLPRPRLEAGERVRVWRRCRTDFTDRFTRIAEAVRGLTVDDAPIDGEAVVFRADGKAISIRS